MSDRDLKMALEINLGAAVDEDLILAFHTLDAELKTLDDRRDRVKRRIDDARREIVRRLSDLPRGTGWRIYESAYILFPGHETYDFMVVSLVNPGDTATEGAPDGGP